MMQIKFVANNDLKKNQTTLSKQFVLGFYYFEIEMSHHNPLIFKRVGLLNLDLVLQKGSQIYKNHVQALIKEINTCQAFKINKNKLGK